MPSLTYNSLCQALSSVAILTSSPNNSGRARKYSFLASKYIYQTGKGRMRPLGVGDGGCIKNGGRESQEMGAKLSVKEEVWYQRHNNRVS